MENGRKLVKKIMMVALCLGLPLSILGQALDDIYFATEQYPPYNFQQKGELKGIAVDILDEVLKKDKSNQSLDNINLLPWSRGYMYAQKKRNTCLFSTTRTEKREKMFKWAGPIASTTITLIARKDRKIAINSITGVSSYTIGVVKDDIGEQLIHKGGIPLDKLVRAVGVNAIRNLVGKLNKGAIDMWAYDQNVAMWELKSLGFNPNDYEVVEVLKKGNLYFAFHLDTDEKVIAQFQKYIDEIKSEGVYQQILDKYLK